MRRLPMVGVMGSGTSWTREAPLLGALLAGLELHLLTGGGAGQMLKVAEAFVRRPGRSGLSVGVLPCHPEDPTRTKNDGYPNSYVEMVIRTHLMASGEAPSSRNHVNILSSDLVVCLVGAEGTLSEARLARRYNKERCLFLLPETQQTHDCSALLQEFSEDEIFSSLEGLEQWLEERFAHFAQSSL